MMRDSVKKKERIHLPHLGLALFLAICLFCMSFRAEAVTTHRVWSSPITGHAIDGYDPVAYFTQSRPRKGVQEYELVWAGVAWRFVNSGNMDAFRRNPEIYAPQMGSYALDGLLHNVLLPPNPLQWVLYDKKLYLFSSPRAKNKFEKNTQENLRTSSDNWHRLKKDINE